ncbi:hypothetical protein HMPREF1219_01302 [Corynebacterium pyruviciproducens ATCC BAA-1742]|uniref:Carbohydrate-binding domain-containing protein n=1 Tax=Corynebacterium pyruviciproducens ATCC BAA-1742 TaxID=1125779 RepID=S2Z5B5_9CORY|nr:carbohydrate-binding domain-containing protein [Corynebacterium pyruviciproducens]EPD69430.1 hypothetical protein HMPREF1219_01302 [Corynebacterium pyruviciproducens ATCC BAA-1742]
MKLRMKKCVAVAAVVGMLGLAGCDSTTQMSPAASSQAVTQTVSQETSGTWDTTNPPTAAEEASENSEPTVVEAATSNAKEVNLSGDESLEITEAGTYRISGETSAGVTVTAAEGEVTLILDGVTIGNGIAINDGDVALVVEDTNTVRGEVSAASDLTISGDGKLTVEAPEDGIVAKDDLTITGGTLSVTAGDDALQGTDSVTISGGELTLTAGGDAVKSSKDDDTTKGWVRVTSGSVTATAGDDALSAVTDVLIGGGTLSLSSTDKAINAGTFALVDDGSVTVTADDDGIHSDGALRVSGGEVTISAGDDGLHSEVAATISGGKVNVDKSEEALEGGLVTISDGEVNLTSNDDGINGSGSTTVEAGLEAIAAADNSSETETREETGEPPAGGAIPGEPPAGGMPPQGMGGGMPGESTGEQVTITGGTVTINAGGDGLDSNGDATVSGGQVTVNGPENNGNGALDVAGAFEVTGGTVAALGSAGMAQAPTTGEGWVQANVSAAAGDTIEVKDESGTVVATLTAKKKVGNVVYASPEITSGATYTVGDQTVTAGTATSGGMGGGMPGAGGPGMDRGGAMMQGYPDATANGSASSTAERRGAPGRRQNTTAQG